MMACSGKTEHRDEIQIVKADVMMTIPYAHACHMYFDRMPSLVDDGVVPSHKGVVIALHSRP